jgi:hypothetical protein
MSPNFNFQHAVRYPSVSSSIGMISRPALKGGIVMLYVLEVSSAVTITCCRSSTPERNPSAETFRHFTTFPRFDKPR